MARRRSTNGNKKRKRIVSRNAFKLALRLFFMDYNKVAEEFGKRIWKIKDSIALKDILLYGSVLEGKENPNDIDLLILHQNPLLDRFHFETMYKNISNQKKYLILSELLKKQTNLEKVLSNPSIKKTIENNQLHPQYMNTLFFKGGNYRKKWINYNNFHKPHHKHNQEKFLKHIFNQGKLWNPLTEKYDISPFTKYEIPQSQNLKINS